MTQQGEDDGDTVCRLIRGLKAQEAELRSAIDRRSITLRKKGQLLERLQAQRAPEEGMVRQYLKTIYETDRDLVETLAAAKQQLTAMDRAVERPVVVGEALRYARVVRPITTAPIGWNERIPWIPRDPFKPSNLCIAASRLRKYQTEMEEKRREREKSAGEADGAEGMGPPSLSREATVELIHQFSTEFEPPPGWTPGQPIDLKPDVVAKIRHQVEEEGMEQARKRGLSVSSETEAGVVKDEEVVVAPPPLPKPKPPPQQPVLKKPKKQTFMMDEDEDDEASDDEAEEEA